jgi:FkbM family methyltransferase
MIDGPTEAFRSHAQSSAQDIIILKFFNDKSDGYYVDLASNHYEEGSNTYVLDYFNRWKGVCIEPNPVYLEGLLSNRKCTLISSAVSKTAGEVVQFRFHHSGGLGGMVGDEFDNQGSDPNEDKPLVTTTLTDILDFVKAPRVMDYLSLDVEGAEHYVLSGLDHSRYTFLAVTIERPKHHSHYILSKAGYRFVYQMAGFGECIYLHQSKSDFELIMSQYRQANSVPNWNGEERAYLLHPLWNAPYTEELDFHFA